MLTLAVLLVSASSLSYEVLLTRFFSLSQWHHLSFMVLSIVLFGFAASGSLLCVLESRRPGLAAALSGRLWQARLLALFSAATSASYLLLARLPLDYFLIPLLRSQLGYLLASFLMLALPFFFAGLIIALAYVARPRRSGWIYLTSMLGSAAGALLPAPLLAPLGEGRIVILTALLNAALALAVSPLRRRRGKPTAAACLLLCAVTLGLFSRPQLLAVKPSPYKLLSQALQYPGTRVLYSRNGLRARVDIIESRAIRFAPGLSLTYQGGLAGGALLLEDADTLFCAYPPWELDFARSTLSYAGYALSPRPGKVLIAQQSGGLAAAAALAAGAERVRLLVELPEAARFYRRRYSGTALQPEAAAFRSWLAASQERFDLIQLEGWGPSYPGAASLEQDYSLTVEALEQGLAHLEAGGLLVLSRRLHYPPADCLRAYATAYEALRRRGAGRPARHIAMLRSWDVYTLLAAAEPLEAEKLARLKAFCRAMSFDLVAYDGMPPEEANRYNQREEPVYYLTVDGLRAAYEAGRENAFFRAYDLAVRPAGDDRCFYNRFTRWLRLGALLRGRVSRVYSLLLSGEVVVLAVLLVALLLGALLLLLPLGFAFRTARAARGREPPGRFRPLGGSGTGYFLAGGAGFMLVEMGFIQAYRLIFPDPVLCFSVLLCAVLVLSGAGGAVSSRLQIRQLAPLLAALSACLAGLGLLLQPALRSLLALPAPWREALALLLLAPPSFAIGLFFPAGLRLLVDRPQARAYAWGANGIASVLGSVLAVPLAMAAGTSKVLLAAAVCYLLALLFLRRPRAGFRTEALPLP
jgi:hypothetical protein